MLLNRGYLNNSRLRWLCSVLLLLHGTHQSIQADMFEGDDCEMKNMPGKCALGSTCTTFRDGIKQKIFTLADKVHCGFSVYEEIICCPNGIDGNTAPQVSSTTVKTVSTRGNGERPAVAACRSIDEGLEVALTPHIIGGTVVDLGEYPHMAAIGYRQIGDSSGPYQFRCGGSLIARRFVLTAAHCVAIRDPQASIVRMGVTNFTDPEQMRNVVEVPIRLVHIHPNYSDLQKIHDIALVELEQEVNYTKDVYPICLQTELSDPSPNDKLFVTGYGHVTIESRTFSNILLKAQLDIVPLSQCILQYNADHPSLTVGHLCAHDAGLQKDACHGDSGGPLNLVLDEQYRQYRVVGVIAAGIECVSPVPGLYTRVAAHLDFIEKIVWPDL